MGLRLPSPYAIFAVAVVGVFGIVTTARGLVDSDYYGHITVGRLIAEHGILTTDPFSYTWAGRPWVMHEWLGQLLMYWLVNGAGVAVATFVFGVISVSGPLLVAWSLCRRGLALTAVVLVASLVLYVFASYATIRPQAISWLMLGALIAGLLSLRPDHRWLPWLSVPFFALWANVHGLYVIGLGVLGVYVLFTLLGRTPMASRRWTVAGIFGAAFAASTLTPAGPEGLLYPLRYVDAGDWGLRHISEWQSPDFHDPAQLSLLVLIAALLFNGMRATPTWLVAMAASGLAGALLATRNVPLLGLLAMPTLTLGLADRVSRPASSHPLRIQRIRRVMEISVAAIVLVATALIVPRLPAVAGEEIIPRTFPVSAVDRLESVDPGARIFAEYQWGGYVSYRLFDSGARVFVDGRNDMYDESILQDFVTIRNAEDGWEALLRRYGADAILLPPEAGLVRGSALDAGWCEEYRDDVAVLLRKCG
ncbi:MAG: hypothetical protein M3153_00540 [Chloroflexota bacterium]|nr:hypothetical protein [Chloroflexota bacterium]